MKAAIIKTMLLLTFLNSAINVLPCTTFLISGKITADGKPILFKQRDTDVLQNSLVLFNDGQYRYIGIVNGSNDWKDMVWGGYNETGFAIINSAAYNNNIGDTAKIIDQEGVVMKKALQTCRTLQDFEELLKSMPKPMGVDANFGVIDAFGGAAFYETGNYDFKKYDINDTTIAPNGFLVRTNHSMRGDLKKGYGFCRYNTAQGVLQQAITEQTLTPQFLFNNISRNLTHSLTNTNLFNNIPKDKNIQDFRFFIDYIPRYSTSAAIMIIGAKNSDTINETMMWTILGFPLTSVAVPVWITESNTLPKIVSINADLKSPLCTATLKLKEDCFPLDYDRGSNYINLAAVINEQENGSMQILQREENAIFSKTNHLLKSTDFKNLNNQSIQNHYNWLDNYITELYMRNFGINLFKTED